MVCKLIDDLPEEIFWVIFSYLTHEEIFDFGQCSQKTKTTVLRYVQHPLSTVMEGIRTMRNLTLGIRTRYDEFCTHSAFKFANKCDSCKCMCQRYCQRKRMTIINPALCQLCINTENTTYCVQDELALDCFLAYLVVKNVVSKDCIARRAIMSYDYQASSLYYRKQ